MSFRFTVTVDTKNGTKVSGGFSDVTGLGAETEVQTLRVGGLNEAEVMLAGPTKFPSRLVLKRGLADPALWNWYLDILYGAIKRENVTIELRLYDGHKTSQAAALAWESRSITTTDLPASPPAWTFREACPVKWSGPELHAGTSAVAFETIELVHRGLLVTPAIEQAHRGFILSPRT
jgi:phage tail-like protein